MLRKILFFTTAVLALIGLAAAPSAAQYADVDPALAVNKGEVAQGDCYVLSGTDFEAGAVYEIGSIYGGENDGVRALPNTETTTDLGTVTADAEGAFSIQLEVSADAPLGFYTIGIDEEITEIEDGQYSNIANITIEVVAGDGTSDCPGGGTTTTTAPGNGGTNNGGPGVNNGTLPRTGSSTLPMVGAGLGLLAAGGALLFVNKRRSIV